MSEFDEESEGGGLRRQLEQTLQEIKSLKESLPTQLQEAEQRGQAQAERRYQAREAFGTLGFPKVADLWVKEHPEGDLTPDGAKEFLTAYGLEPKIVETQPTEQVPSEVKEQMAAFTAPVPAGTGNELLTRSEFDEMMRDPDRRPEAIRAAQQGRVKLNNPEASKVEGVLRVGPPA